MNFCLGFCFGSAISLCYIQVFLEIKYHQANLNSNQIRYSIHIVDIYNIVQFNNKGTIQYYLDFVFELFVISTDLLNYLHMLVR